MMNIVEFAEELVRRGWCVCPDFLAGEPVAELANAAHDLWNRGAFHKAGTGRGAGLAIRHEVRGDHILWLDECDVPAVRRLLADEIETLRRALNAAGYLGLHEFEGQFAVYPPGGGYARHWDRFHDSDARVVSLVLYLNQVWQPGDGGELRLYPDSEQHDAVTVMPAGGTLVGFLSAQVLHEVLPAQRERFSLSGWFRRRE